MMALYGTSASLGLLNNIVIGVDVMAAGPESRLAPIDRKGVLSALLAEHAGNVSRQTTSSSIAQPFLPIIWTNVAIASACQRGWSIV